MSDTPTTSDTNLNLNLNLKPHKTNQLPLTVPTDCTCFRLLCHASRIGGVIGKSGHVIKQFQRQTTAKIRVETPNPNSDDRIITIIGNTQLNKTMSFNNNNINNNNNNNDFISYEVSAAQEALIKVFERILYVAAEAEGGDLASGGVVSCRLLVDKSVIGAVIGKKGKVIEKIRRDTGCKVRVLGEDKMTSSSCALVTDEMVEIEGDNLAIKKALLAVTGCLQERSYAHKAKTVLGGPHHAVSHETIINGHTDISSVSSDGDTCPPQQEIVFRMLCSSDRMGSVIGKSGTIIQALQNESGASISFNGPVAGCDERVITITSKETLESRNSAAQNAAILVYSRIETASSSGVVASARLLISQNQMGCLLGKGGSVIADMRKVTGAVIKIVGDHQVPKCALETDQVVLMTGEFVNVRDALYSVTGRLRTHFFSSKMLKGHGMRGPHANLHRSMEGLKLSSSIEHPAKPHTRVRKGNKASTSVKGGTELISSGGRLAIVTSMSVEIVVPQNVIGRVLGENESNLTLLRQISGAKVVVHEPQSGTTDHIVVISGTPDETQSAQSLLQAFILSDQS
ncbi:KH domain-containing protein HEN4-like [Bidens hawaiensis]|uniref:KH domain-containing protein HEN4-like n=1 Tax=Bidens hawaiensis TaxID=980011 RepID=UPI0040493E0C